MLEGAKTLWDFQIQSDMRVKANQLNIMIIDKQWKTAIMIDGNIRKLEKNQGVRVELEEPGR